MKINYKIVAGTLAALCVFDTVQNLRGLSEIKKLQGRNKRLSAGIAAQQEQIMYYADKLDKHGVPMTSFDEIAIKTIVTEF